LSAFFGFFFFLFSLFVSGFTVFSALCFLFLFCLRLSALLA